MRDPAERARMVLFCACALALVLAAILSSTGSERDEPRPQPAPRFVSGALRRLRPVGPALRSQARRFLFAFFRSELGESGAEVRRALRRTATAGFGRALLARSPFEGGRPRVPARLVSLSIQALPALASRALVSGTALRGQREEQFSFLFLRRRGIWLAAGPGE